MRLSLPARVVVMSALLAAAACGVNQNTDSSDSNPLDYDFNLVDIIMPMEAHVMLDVLAIPSAPTPIASGFGIARVALPDVGAGAHLITSDLPVGIQVSGYGQDTSFMYPGGLNLELIAPPPPPQ